MAAGSALALAMVLSMKDKASKTAGKAGKALKGLGKLAGGVALGAVAAGGAMAGMALKMASDSAKIDATRKTFDKLAISIGSDGPAALALLGDATRGMVADSDLMLAGNKFLAMGLADSAQGAADLAEMATQLGMAMGEDATGSMENFALMLANQSIPRLDSFGISSSVVRERILELMKANEDMTREQAFMAAVMEQGTVTMAKVGEQSASLAAKTEMAKAQFANFKDVLGQAFMPILNMVMDGLGTLAKKYGPAVIAWVQGASAVFSTLISEFQSGFGAGGGGLQGIIWGIGEALDNFLPEDIMDKVWTFLEGAQSMGTWIGEMLPIALAKLSEFWQTHLLPAIQVVSAFVTTTIFPMLETLFTWLQDKTPGALATLATFWSETLYPAILLVWDFLKTSVIPLVQSFIDVQITLLSKALEILAAVWAEKIKPALEKFWEQIGGLEGALDGIKNAIGWVIDKLKKFKKWLDSISLPDWLTPGSPSPLEKSLRGIAEGFEIANKGAGKFALGIKGIADGTASLKQVTTKLMPSWAELFAQQFDKVPFSAGGGSGGDVGPGGEAPGLLPSIAELLARESALRYGGAGYGSGGGPGGNVGPGGEAPSWGDHVIMPPKDTSGDVLGIVQFVFDGKAMGEITLRTGAVAETSIDMTALVMAKG